jgi:hypothetical protein
LPGVKIVRIERKQTGEVVTPYRHLVIRLSEKPKSHEENNEIHEDKRVNV